MKALRTHVAGVDVHKDVLAITTMIGGGDEDPRIGHLECSTMTDDLKAMGIVLRDMGIKDVAMESTGVYWKPVHNVWDPMGLNVIIGNASHIKNVPGRKTDVKDSQWIAQLHRFGLIRPSFVPEGVFQRLRLLSRHRTNLVEDLSRVKNRVEKVLQDGNIKWSSIVSDTFGVAGITILNLIADGVTNAQTLAASVTTKIKRKADAEKALTNCLTTEHLFVIRELMIQYRDITSRIQAVEGELAERMRPYAHLIAELDKIPGIEKTLAMGIIAEATTDMSQFPDERRFAAWAGVAPGNHESAGKKKRTKCRQGNPHIRKIFIQAANGAKQKRGSFYRAKYRKLAARLGSPNKAKVAIANRLARAVYKVLGGSPYKDLGYMRGDPLEKQVENLVRKLRSLGVDIKHENHQMIVSTRKVTVDQTGIVLK
jgi:transposase